MQNLVRAALTVALLLSSSLTYSHPSVTHVQTKCQERIVVFLQGLATRFADSPQTFNDIEAAVGDYYQKKIHFNYRLGNDRPYDEVDTYQSFPRSVSALTQTITQELERCHEAIFDLIGHSLGGAIAITLLGNQEYTPLGSRIKRVITLDSPVNGSSQETVIQWLKFLDKVLEREWGIFGAGRLINDRFGSDVVDQLTHSFEHGRGEVIAGVVSRVEGRTAIHTLTSADDYIMPIKDAIVEGVEKIWSLGNFTPFDWDDIQCRSDEQLGACLGHTQILHDPQVLSYLRAIIGVAEPVGQTSLFSPNPAARIESAPLTQGSPNFTFTANVLDKPLVGHNFVIGPAVKDIAGQWAIPQDPHTEKILKTDRSGQLAYNLPPGDHFIYQGSNLMGGGIGWAQSSQATGGRIPSNWGQQARPPGQYSYKVEGVVFTIEPDQQIRITLTLSTLDVGVLTASGNADSSRMVYVLCQTTNSTGKKVHNEDRCPGKKLTYRKTDTRGVAHFVLGPGHFIVCPEYHEPVDEACAYDVQVEPGEAKEIRITSRD